MTEERRAPGSDRRRDWIETSIRRGLAAYQEGDLDAAASALDEVLPGLEAEMPELWERLGNAYFETSDFERALDVLERVVSAGRASAGTWERLAACARELERPAEELRYREAAVDQAPEDPSRWRELGLARRRAGKSPEAVTALREAVRLDGNDAAGTGIELGRALRDAGDLEAAAAAYRETLTRRPDRSDVWSDLASLYSELGRFAESDQAVREAIRLRPANASAWHTIATNTLKQGERDTAQRAYRRMKELNPDFADEILSWVSNTSGLPPDTVGEPVLAAAVASGKRRGRLLAFRHRT
jgi:tetratricopeptide (TPR) repeat protein